MHLQGKRIPKDYAEAVTWYRKAAEQGHSEAQFSLGLMYVAGQGVSLDGVEAFREALKWYRRAAEQGHSDAQYLLGSYYVDGLGEVIPQDWVEAEKWLRKAAEQGDANAQFNLRVDVHQG